jgi:nucleotide-binding universal stress UspA family protein
MNRHILVATDGSSNALNSLHYVAGVFKDVPDVDCTLITVAEPLPPVLTQGGTSFQAEKDRLRRLDEVDKKREEECAGILTRSKAVLQREGVPDARIHLKHVLQSRSVVQDILLEARRGLYDALVVGRRGLGALVSYFMGGVSYGLIQHLKDLAVWIVDEPLQSNRFLIAIDACEPCMKVVDHASFALAGVKDVKVTVLHVIPRFHPFLSRETTASFEDVDHLMTSLSEERIQSWFPAMRDTFRDAGFSGDSVEIKVIKGGAGIVREILTEYNSGGYGTLVVGRRGIGGWEAIFPGSVSDRLSKTLTKGALWIVG